MHSSWQSFLEAQGARIESGVVTDFGAPHDELRAARSGTIVADLSQFALLQASGSDAPTFLNNQLTNDLAKLDATQALYAGYCSAKGRLLANFLLWQRAEDFMLQLDAQVSAATLKRLSMYVLRAKVKLRDASEDWVRIGVSGAQAAALLAEAAAPAPQEAMTLARSDAVTVIKLGAQRYQLLAPPENAPQIWQALTAQARAVGAAAWRWLDIRAGIPWITTGAQELFVPQMANFDRFGGLTYTKGCYPGQEIVARTHYLGKLKRRMHRAHIDSARAPQPGDELFGQALGEQSCGNIVNAAPAPDGGYDALAVIQSESLAGTIHIWSISGPILSFLDLPYTLD